MRQRHPRDTHMGFPWGARRRSGHCWTTSKVKISLKGRSVMFFTLLCWLDGSRQHLFPATELLMENTLVMAKAPFLLPKASPQTTQGWIAGLTAQGILPVITGNRFRHVVQLCPKICDYYRMIYAANERANGSQDLSSCVSICFPNVFFSLSLLGSWEFGFCCWFGVFSCQRSCLLMAWQYQATRKRHASRKQWLDMSCTVNWF